MLRVSDGEFTSNQVLRTINSVGNTGDLTGRQITGLTSGATAIVENLNRYQIGDKLVSELLLNQGSIVGTFSVGETIMFVIFKKNSDDDNLLDRKDEDELEEENDDTNLDFNDKSEQTYSNVSSGHSEEE